MRVTTTLLAKPKSKLLLVLLESVVTGHKYLWLREKTADKLEVIRYDPHVRAEVVYKEIKKVKSH